MCYRITRDPITGLYNQVPIEEIDLQEESNEVQSEPVVDSTKSPKRRGRRSQHGSDGS